MTNDGDFANMLMHPSYKVEKKYVVKVQGIPTRDKLMPLKDGLVVDRKKLAPAKFKQISSDKLKNTAIIQLTIHQGINHQVKKMFKAIGYPVMKLAREQYGPLTLEGLQPGEYRPLKREEIRALEALAQKG